MAATQATKKSPPLLSTRACARSIITARLAEMGITKDDLAVIVNYLKADAAAHGGKYRMSRIVEAMRVNDFTATAEAIRFAAGLENLAAERGPGEGEGSGGRPEGARDLNPRKRRGPDPHRPSRQEDVYRLRAEHPDWTLEQIGAALGMTKSGVSKHLLSRRPK